MASFVLAEQASERVFFPLFFWGFAKTQFLYNFPEI
jgi:hypothetical protein